MSTTQSNLADGVSSWTNLGIKLPEELAEAVELFEVLRYVEVGRVPVFDTDGLTQANAEDRIRQFAQELALVSEPGSLGPLDRAKNAAVDAAARTVIGLARHFVPDAIEQLEPGFQEHAEAYRTAVANLPDVITADRLLAAGPAAVESYRAAQTRGRVPGRRLVLGSVDRFAVGHPAEVDGGHAPRPPSGVGCRTDQAGRRARAPGRPCAPRDQPCLLHRGQARNRVQDQLARGCSAAAA
jgi:hypothetical protein